MKKTLFIFLLANVIGSMFLTSCKKQDALDANVQQFNSDANKYKAELDQADGDINDILKDMSIGKTEDAALVVSSPLCGAIIDSTNISQKIIYINFDGVTPCSSPSRTRSGQIKIQLTSGNRWRDQGAVLTMTFTNYKVTRMSDNKSITFNGVKTLKNLNGINWWTFVLGSSTFRFQERALNIAVTFDGNQSATWNSTRLTEWSYALAGSNSSIPYAHIKFNAQGDTTMNGFGNVDTWGTNRFGESFTTYYNSPVHSNTHCGLWRFTSGELVHHVNNSDFTLTLGVTQAGTPTPLACAYGYKVSWTSGTNSRSVILSY